jgi:hypothetical protein
VNGDCPNSLEKVLPLDIEGSSCAGVYPGACNFVLCRNYTAAKLLRINYGIERFKKSPESGCKYRFQYLVGSVTRTLPIVVPPAILI